MRSKDSKGKVKAGMEERDKPSPILDEEVLAGRFAKESDKAMLMWSLPQYNHAHLRAH